MVFWKLKWIDSITSRWLEYILFVAVGVYKYNLKYFDVINYYYYNILLQATDETRKFSHCIFILKTQDKSRPSVYVLKL